MNSSWKGRKSNPPPSCQEFRLLLDCHFGWIKWRACIEQACDEFGMVLGGRQRYGCVDLGRCKCWWKGWCSTDWVIPRTRIEDWDVKIFWPGLSESNRRELIVLFSTRYPVRFRFEEINMSFIECIVDFQNYCREDLWRGVEIPYWHWIWRVVEKTRGCEKIGVGVILEVLAL